MPTGAGLAAPIATLRTTAGAGALKLTGELVHYGLNVAPPLITPASGEYEYSVEVAMSCATVGAVIHYTTDGSEPTLASPIYSTPFTLVP